MDYGGGMEPGQQESCESSSCSAPPEELSRHEQLGIGREGRGEAAYEGEWEWETHFASIVPSRSSAVWVIWENFPAVSLSEMRWSQDGDCQRTHELLRDDELQARIVLSAGEKHRNVLPAHSGSPSGFLNFFPLINVSHPSMPGAYLVTTWDVQVRLLMEELRPLMGQVRRMSVQARQIKTKRKKLRRKRTRAPKTVQVRQDEVQVRLKPKFGQPSDPSKGHSILYILKCVT
ncbi:hypothetical protein B0H14DRAFT_2581020 [Mycena olivaceomarginata]|nr:hypothetical protein B0H14DRAFT_2581020 [Mycena olivaceomarginata]